MKAVTMYEAAVYDYIGAKKLSEELTDTKEERYVASLVLREPGFST